MEMLSREVDRNVDDSQIKMFVKVQIDTKIICTAIYVLPL